jgi:hypothetical protein
MGLASSPQHVFGMPQVHDHMLVKRQQHEQEVWLTAHTSLVTKAVPWCDVALQSSFVAIAAHRKLQALMAGQHRRAACLGPAAIQIHQEAPGSSGEAGSAAARLQAGNTIPTLCLLVLVDVTSMQLHPGVQ